MEYRIKFKVNGEQYSVGKECSSDVMLLDYLRGHLQLRGTKYMCREGGCGACIVTTSKTPDSPSIAINSCLVSIGSCDGWSITTIEGLGNRKDGYHPLQTTLASKNGSQCGYCSVGWVMAMHGLLESKKKLTKLEIEKSFGSNVCRCTGYRPILDAFKTFASDESMENSIPDIEDLSICQKNGKPCDKSCEEDWCVINKDRLHDNEIKMVNLSDGKKWYIPENLQDVFSILEKEGTESYMLVGGNTAKGAHPIESYPDILISISKLEALRKHSNDGKLTVGVETTLTEFLDILESEASKENFGYLIKLHNHISKVAHIPVRNMGTIAGNLMTKHKHRDFPSDIFLLLTTVNAQLTVVASSDSREIVTMEDFLNIDMKGKLLLNVTLPPMNDKYKLETFKIMPRAQSAHAIVNAGFLFQLNQDNTVESARIVYGGLSDDFVRANESETCLVGKNLFTNETLQEVLKVLDKELIVLPNPPAPSVEYRKQLAKGLFYKSLLILCPDSILDPKYKSGAVDLHDERPVSKAKQNYPTNPSLYPYNEPIPRIEGTIQCAGEAHYIEDIPTLPDEVFGAFVLSTVAIGTIAEIDPCPALAIPGVIAFYCANSIPGINSYTPNDVLSFTSLEEIVCSGKVKYFNQPIGIIVAKTQQLANRAINYVKVTYTDTEKPVIDLKEAKKDLTRNTIFITVPALLPGLDIKKVLKGSNTIYGQYHYTMETLVCVAMPTEEGIEVHPSTQWLDVTHLMLSRALAMDHSKIDVHVRRIGGGYGLKLSRGAQSAIACSLVVLELNRPCRFIQPITTNFRAVGKRLPAINDYEVAVNSSGEIQYLNSTIYEDNGYKINEILALFTVDSYYNCYQAARINYTAVNTVTDTAKNSWCRAPGTVECTAFAEYIMDRISYELSLDPIEVRLANLNKNKYSDLIEMAEKVKKDGEYDKTRAEVDKFNCENRWKKRGLRFVFTKWSPLAYQHFDMNLSVFHGDATVIITHGAIEMGQGVNTKAVQIAAHKLNISVDKIQVKPNNTTITPNSDFTGASLTTHSLILGIVRCCEKLLERLEPTKTKMNNPTWEELITAAYADDVDLQVHGHTGLEDIQYYDVYGAALCLLETDVLTGQHEILRVDLLQDCGLSISPGVDVGQVMCSYEM